ncbi:MAG TPA: hypothetical protein VG328_04130 [Stellaceae bacterium]|jgi:hypothetical protein|nr:hypothetical protein [Stellaceae bacterium]
MTNGIITLGEIAAKLRMLHVTCDRCGRADRYGIARLVKEYGAESSIQQFQDDITRDCVTRGDPTIALGSRCELCPDLSKLARLRPNQNAFGGYAGMVGNTVSKPPSTRRFRQARLPRRN